MAGSSQSVDEDASTWKRRPAVSIVDGPNLGVSIVDDPRITIAEVTPRCAS